MNDLKYLFKAPLTPNEVAKNDNTSEEDELLKMQTKDVEEMQADQA
jgi:hypothetical protein